MNTDKSLFFQWKSCAMVADLHSMLISGSPDWCMSIGALKTLQIAVTYKTYLGHSFVIHDACCGYQSYHQGIIYQACSYGPQFPRYHRILWDVFPSQLKLGCPSRRTSVARD